MRRGPQEEEEAEAEAEGKEEGEAGRKEDEDSAEVNHKTTHRGSGIITPPRERARGIPPSTLFASTSWASCFMSFH